MIGTTTGVPAARRTRWRSESGQAALLATLSLPVLLGAVGLTVDIGWDFFQKMRVQTAADAAASAAAVFALNHNDTCATISCGSALSCATVTAPPTTSLQAGCLFALQDGPPVLSASLIENDSAHLPAGLSGVAPTMWVKATVSNNSECLLPGNLRRADDHYHCISHLWCFQCPTGLVRLRIRPECVGRHGGQGNGEYFNQLPGLRRFQRCDGAG